MSSRFLEGVRMIAPVAVAAFLFAFSFGVLARAAESAHIVHSGARLDSVASAAGERGTAPTLGWGYGAWGRAKSALHPVVRKRLAHA